MMDSILQNMPVIWIIYIFIGISCIVWSIIKLGNVETELNEGNGGHKSSDEIKELFSYFLQEEEKKNDGVRSLIKDIAVDKEEKQGPHHTNKQKDNYTEIMKYYESGKTEEWIAKKLGKGVGEVKLIISLYSMQ